MESEWEAPSRNFPRALPAGCLFRLFLLPPFPKVLLCALLLFSKRPLRGAVDWERAPSSLGPWQRDGYAYVQNQIASQLGGWLSLDCARKIESERASSQRLCDDVKGQTNSNRPNWLSAGGATRQSRDVRHATEFAMAGYGPHPQNLQPAEPWLPLDLRAFDQFDRWPSPA
jgi:hypothetical protein